MTALLRRHPGGPAGLLSLTAILVVGLVLGWSSTSAWSLARFTDLSATDAAFAADVLDPPTGLVCTGGLLACNASLLTRPRLSWTATPDTYAQGYRILRSTGGGPSTVVDTVVGHGTTTWTDTSGGLSILTTYTYRVVAYAEAWVSLPSNPVSVTILLGL